VVDLVRVHSFSFCRRLRCLTKRRAIFDLPVGLRNGRQDNVTLFHIRDCAP
jgi:hypothetical protein